MLRLGPLVCALAAGSLLAPAGATAMLSDDTALVGAPAFWTAGLLGGTGPADSSPADLAILQDKIDASHPAFAGLSFQRPTGAPAGACGSGCEHGTAVASIAISQGVSTCPIEVPSCSPADADDKGIAPGLDTVLDASSYGAPSGIDVVAWALGIGAKAAGSGEFIPGATDPAEILNDSHGDIAAVDDDQQLLTYDKAVSTKDVSYVAACGNAGPAASTVNAPGIAYDSLCVGSAATNSGDLADTQVSDSSSRGPTPAGRKKPDLVAVGDTQAAWQHWAADQTLWRRFTGSSLAAPQVAGAATLLAGAGTSSAVARKALLINAARPGRTSPAAAMGTQIAWSPDWGWGLLDLAAALQQRAGVRTSAVAPGASRLFATDLANGPRATLVWNRRATGTWGAGATSTAAALSDLDLEVLDPSTGAVTDTSASHIDNVEQVRGTTSHATLLRVSAHGAIDGRSSEPFALAAAGSLRELATPTPTVTLTANPTIADPGQPITVTATAVNPSPDVDANTAAVTLTLPSGVQLLDGAATKVLGAIAAGHNATATWTIASTAAGSLTLTAVAQADAYGDTYTSVAAHAAATVEALVPPITVPQVPDVPPAPQPAPQGPQSDPVAPQPLPSPLSPLPVLLTVPHPAAKTPTRAAARLRLTRRAIKGTHMTIAGTITARATGRITLTVTTTKSTIRGTATIRRGRFTATLRLRRGTRARTVTARYAGSRSVAPGSAVR